MLSFFGKSKKKYLPRSLKQALLLYDKLEKDLKKLEEQLNSFRQESTTWIKKTGLVRYNPFKEIGGDQSFSVAFLDDQANGFVITSLYSKDSNRIFAKPLEKGSSQYPLTEEEKQAIEKARSNRMS